MRVYPQTAILLLTIVLIGGCVSPATLRPVATDNAANMTNYVSNMNTLLVMYGDALGPLLDIRYGLIQQRLFDQMSQYRSATGVVNEESFRKAVLDLKPAVIQIASIQDTANHRTAEENLLRNNSVIADVALNRIDEAQAISLLNAYFGVARNVRTLNKQMLDIASLRFFLTSDALSLHEQIKKAYGEFVELVNKQGQLSIQHGKAIVQFSNSNASFETVVSILTSDSVKKTIGDFVVAQSGDPARKEAAMAALKDIADAAKK